MRSRTTRAAIVTAGLMLGVAITRATVRRYVIAERSMSPALEPGDWVCAIRSRRPTRGAVVVFAHPRRHDFTLVKRIVGLPGETVTIRDDAVAVDGRTIDEPWAHGPTRPDGEWTLGPNEVFVLSDARTATTADGRALGPIAYRRASWTVVVRYWPAGRVGRVR